MLLHFRKERLWKEETTTSFSCSQMKLNCWFLKLLGGITQPLKNAGCPPPSMNPPVS